MSLLDKIQKANSVRLVEPLIVTPTAPTAPIIDLPILESEDRLNSDLDPTPPPLVEQITPLIVFSKTIMILLGIFFLTLVISTIIKVLILPLFFRSSICRQMCLSCLHNSHIRRAHTTDIFLDIVHIFTGKQIRIYIDTIAAPASSLAFMGSVKLKNFKIVPKNLRLRVDIDWHDCMLIYNKFIIPLPERGTAVPFQPNLLTDFQLQGPYNILLLARYLDTLIQIPHVENQEFMSSTEKLHFEIESPYKKLKSEVHELLATAPPSSPRLLAAEHSV